MNETSFCSLEDELSEEVGCYASSQGMFGPNVANPNVVGGYIVNENAKTPEDYDDVMESQESIGKGTKYIFIRCYQAIYKSVANPAIVVDRLIKIFEKRDPATGNSYNHVALHYMLDDSFFGLSTGADVENDIYGLKRENIAGSGKKTRYIDSCNPEKSLFTVFTVPVTEAEYIKVKHFIEKESRNASLKWVPLDIIKTGLLRVSEKMDSISKGRSKEDAENTQPADGKPKVIHIDEQMVCSTFVAYTLFSCTKYKQYFNKNEIDYHKISPNDIATRLPFAKMAFTGTFLNYEKECAKFVAAHPEFKQYYTKGNK